MTEKNLIIKNYKKNILNHLEKYKTPDFVCNIVDNLPTDVPRPSRNDGVGVGEVAPFYQAVLELWREKEIKIGWVNNGETKLPSNSPMPSTLITDVHLLALNDKQE